MSREEVRNKKLADQRAYNKKFAEEQRQINEAHAKKMQEWETEVKPTKDKRRPFIAWGTSLGLLGVGGLIAGGVTMNMSKEADDLANAYHDAWASATDPRDINSYADTYQEESDRRDLLNVVSISSFAVGGAAIVSTLILVVAAPKLPPKPKRPTSLTSLRPLVGPGAIAVTGTF
jgi:hypothetical protein